MARHNIVLVKDGKRECLVCKIWKDLKDFSIDLKTTTKTNGRCKQCVNKLTKQKYDSDLDYKKKSQERNYKYKLQDKYGLSVEDYQKLLKDYNNSCAICQEKFSDTDRDKKRCIDHSHVTGEVRGLLCANCNTGLGMFKDNLDLIFKAFNYLKDKS